MKSWSTLSIRHLEEEEKPGEEEREIARDETENQDPTEL